MTHTCRYIKNHQPRSSSPSLSCLLRALLGLSRELLFFILSHTYGQGRTNVSV
jgi:hypothetical protein